VGREDAEKVLIIMGSGADVAHETVEYMTKSGEKVGLLNLKLFRPFPLEAFVKNYQKLLRKLLCWTEQKNQDP